MGMAYSDLKIMVEGMGDGDGDVGEEVKVTKVGPKVGGQGSRAKLGWKRLSKEQGHPGSLASVYAGFTLSCKTHTNGRCDWRTIPSKA